MLILPIVNKRRVMNVEVRLKNATKVRRGVCYDDAKCSDIIVNREKFSDSALCYSKDENAPIDFIRGKSILYPRDFLVTTKSESDSSHYDVYEVKQPPIKVNDNLDKLYSKAITDMRCEIPNKPNRGRYVSFDDLGIGDIVTDEKIALLQKVIKNLGPNDSLSQELQKAGISELGDIATFIDNFEYNVLTDSIIPEESLQDTLKALSSINTRDFRNLKKYYKMAKSNTDLYTKISYINKTIYDRPLTISEKESSKFKYLVKKKDDYDYKTAA